MIKIRIIGGKLYFSRSPLNNGDSIHGSCYLNKTGNCAGKLNDSFTELIGQHRGRTHKLACTGNDGKYYSNSFNRVSIGITHVYIYHIGTCPICRSTIDHYIHKGVRAVHIRIICHKGYDGRTAIGNTHTTYGGYDRYGSRIDIRHSYFCITIRISNGSIATHPIGSGKSGKTKSYRFVGNRVSIGVKKLCCNNIFIGTICNSTGMNNRKRSLLIQYIRRAGNKG